MPYRRREDHQRYMRGYHERTRPTPAPEPQASGALPPRGQVIADDDGERLQCHVCGAFKAGLLSHARLAHGITGDAYRERFGIARTLSLWSPAYQAKQRAAALERDQGGVGRQVLIEFGLPGNSSRPKGIDTRLTSRIRSSSSKRRPVPPAPSDSRLGTGGAKLNADQRALIKQQQGQISAPALARTYNVTASYIRQLWKGARKASTDE